MFFCQQFFVISKGGGDWSSLEIALWPEPEEYHSYLWSFYGIVIDIHLYHKYPEFKSIIQIQPGYDMRLFVTPSVVQTDKSVRNIYGFFSLNGKLLEMAGDQNHLF